MVREPTYRNPSRRIRAMRSLLGGVTKRLRHASAVAALGLLVASVGCGSSSNQTAKQARIKAALRKLVRELTAEKRAPLLHVTHGEDLLGVLTLFSEPAPAFRPRPPAKFQGIVAFLSELR